ncbi:MAG: autotransporter assembly complex family protein [Alphaproteobacteria bacterium]
MIAASEDGIAYRPRLEGVDGGALKKLLEASAQLFTQKDVRPLSLAALRRRAQGDVTRLETALKSEAYYEGRVRFAIDTDEDPVGVTLQVETGPSFPVRSFDVVIADDPVPDGAGEIPRNGRALAFAPGSPATGTAILSAQGRAIAVARRLGFAFVRVEDRRIAVDLRDKRVDVTVTLRLGERVRFGPLEITGLERVDRRFLEEYRPWEDGDLYDPDLVKTFAERLQGTGLFSSAQVRAAEEADDQGRLPILVAVSERDRRTIGGGVEFATNTGPGASLFWENRNVGRRGQKLRADLEVAQIRQAGRLTYEQPRFLRFNQSLRLSLGGAIDDTDAFRATTVTASAGVERVRTPRLTVGLGVEGEYARTEDAGLTTNSYLVAVPLSARWDSTNDLLNPTKGQRVSITIAPTAGVNDRFISFVKNDLRLSAYKALGGTDRWVAAGRMRLASIVGESTDIIPSNRRLYAGGGGSVRPIEFQFAGPLDSDGGPAGGRSALEVGAELRIKITDALGIAPFVEGGTVFDESVPSFNETFLVGGGLGAYYLTPAGPFRLDVGVPFNGRPGIDDAFQIYLSLGQSF